MQSEFLKRILFFWRQNLRFKFATFYLVLVLLLAICAPVIPLPFKPQELDLGNSFAPPFLVSETITQNQHWLGTDQLGRDVLANLIYSFRTAFIVALPVILLAVLLGTCLGMAAAYYGNRKLSMSVAAWLLLPFWILLVFYYSFFQRQFVFSEARAQTETFQQFSRSVGWVILISIVFWLLKQVLKTLPFFRKKLPLPLDELVLKIMELLSAVPRLILVLSLAAFAEPGLGNIFFLLSLTFWVGPARLARAETLKIKQLPFIEAAQVSGLPPRRILFHHLLPNITSLLITAFSFGLSSLLGMEATLSFLGIGLPPETPSWGHMLAGARLNLEAWWLVLFPALCLCFTILAVQTFGKYLQKAVASIGG